MGNVDVIYTSSTTNLPVLSMVVAMKRRPRISSRAGSKEGSQCVLASPHDSIEPRALRKPWLSFDEMVAIYLTNPDHLGNILDSKPERLGNFSEWKCVEELHVWTTVSTINHFVEAGPSRKRYWERDARAAACAVEDDAIVSLRV